MYTSSLRHIHDPVLLSQDRNFFWPGEVISITYSEYVPVALVIQHAKRMRRNVMSSGACTVVESS